MQTLVFLQEHAKDGYTSVPEIAAHLELSPSFLSKVLSQLVESGILNSQKGPGGGVRLGKSARDIRLLEVIQAIDGLGFRDRCALGHPDCHDSNPCPLHGSWGPIREQIIQMLSQNNLESLVSSPARKAKVGRSRPVK